MKIQEQLHPGAYRQDIDGLRAIAVLSVILFHIEKTLLPGGFVGVDIFFVISGYLISRNLVQDLALNRLSFVGFYSRRVKRIAPAMLVVVLATLVAAQIIMLPDDAKATAKSAEWALASLSNVYFSIFQNTGYFAQSSAELPLLHLWSLGVEEQFYVVWPVFLALIYPRLKKNLFIAAVLGTALISFLLGEAMFSQHPSFAYYMLPTRAGELLFGAIVAIAVENHIENFLPQSASTPIAIAGAFLLIGSLIFLSEDKVFPGLLAIPPTAGAALLILSGHLRQNKIAHLLSLKPLRWVGLVSYSAYLWHWPLLAFYRYGYGSPNLISGTIIFLLTILLAWITYRYVEQPGRKFSGLSWKKIFGPYVAASAVLFFVALFCAYSGTFSQKPWNADYQKQLTNIQDTNRPANELDYVCQRKKIEQTDITNTHCVVGSKSNSGSPEILLWGDSNAAHYIGMIEVFAKNSGFHFRNLEVGTCPPMLSDVRDFVDIRRIEDCRSSQILIQEVIAKTDVVIIAAAWNFYQQKSERFIEHFFESTQQLVNAGKTIILIGKIPEMDNFDRRCKEKSLSYPLLKCTAKKAPISQEVASINEKLREFALTNPRVHYFDATSYLCPNGLCSAYSTDGEQIYFDRSHLSMSGSWKLGQQIYATEGIPKAFASIAFGKVD